MTELVHCICLRVVKHSDNRSIATVWTRQRGRMALSLPAGNTPAARRLRALVQPLSAFEGIAHWRPGQEIAAISDVRSIGIPVATASDPTRSIVALFLADFLYAVLRESAPDTLMTDYILSEVSALASVKAAALPNFHLLFATRLTQFLGIAPDTSGYRPGMIFDMREARYCLARPTHGQYVEGAAARMPVTLDRLTHRTLHLLHLTRDERNAVLDAILQYYTIHYSPVASLTSLQVIREIFR